MKILIVEPGKSSRRADIPHTLKDMQRTVSGSIQAVYPWDDPVALVCDEEGLINGKTLNRYIMPGMIIAGTFFICGLGEEDFADLPDELTEKYEKLLRNHQIFCRFGKDILALNSDGSTTMVEM